MTNTTTTSTRPTIEDAAAATVATVRRVMDVRGVDVASAIAMVAIETGTDPQIVVDLIVAAADPHECAGGAKDAARDGRWS